MFFNNKFNTFFGLNLTLVYTFPMCMAWRFRFPIRKYDFKKPVKLGLPGTKTFKFGYVGSRDVSFRLAYSLAVGKCQVNVLLLTLNVNTDVLITSCFLVNLCQITSEHFWTGYFIYPCLINKYT